MSQSIHSYIFLTEHKVISPITILERYNDARALMRLWAIMESYEMKRNQLLYRRERLGDSYV